MKRVYFDMDGTIADLYNFPNWLSYFENEKEGIFSQLSPMIDAKRLNDAIAKAKAKGHKFGVITWLPKNSTAQYRLKCSLEKIDWIKKNVPELKDNIMTCEYGTSKADVAHANSRTIIFDDDENVRKDWIKTKGQAYEPSQILEVLEGLSL
jgi:hypothetical protein